MVPIIIDQIKRLTPFSFQYLSNNAFREGPLRDTGRRLEISLHYSKSAHSQLIIDRSFQVDLTRSSSPTDPGDAKERRAIINDNQFVEINFLPQEMSSISVIGDVVPTLSVKKINGPCFPKS
jgi:hypothetical protein